MTASTSAPRILGATAFSFALHIGLVALVALWARPPELDFEVELPAEVEFGVVEGGPGSKGSPLLAQAPVAPAAPSSPGLGPAVPDAGTPAPEPPQEKGLDNREDQELQAADPEEASGFEEADQGEAALPAGTQLAVRVNMALIRNSPLNQEVRRLLSTIPDWKALLEGSGIDPLADVDRLMIASPNFRSREKIVLAGEHNHDPQYVRAVVARMAQAHGVQPQWRTRAGVPVTRWATSDPTVRTVALLGPQHFIISRPQDLPRVLAAARSVTRAKREGKPSHDASSLLDMNEGEVLSLQVEGAQRFVRGNQAGIPTRMQLSARTIGDQERQGALIAARAAFESAAAARAAKRYWGRVRDQYANQPMVALLGLRGPLARATLEQQDAALTGELRLGEPELRLILRFAGSALGGQPPR